MEIFFSHSVLISGLNDYGLDIQGSIPGIHHTCPWTKANPA